VNLESQRFLGEILVRRGALTDAVLAEALAKAEERDVPLKELLLAAQTVEEEVLVKALADEMGMEFAKQIAVGAVPEDLIEKVPIQFARTHRVVPIGEAAGRVRVAMADPLDPYALDDLRALLGRKVQPIAVPAMAIDDAINRIYDRRDEAALNEAKDNDDSEELLDIIDMTDEAPVIRWVNNLFFTSVRERASDIHIEPTDDKVVVRYRVDGKLIPVKEAHRGFLPSIVARVKIEAGLNIAEKRLPQDGRITKKIAGKVVDVRVSTIPTAKGERVTMRLLDKENVMLDLTDLGFARRQLETINSLVHRPNGIVLVTGPTGSGKTTTLYGCLNMINQPDVNILTAEDPVEYELPGIGQLHVQPKIGLTFAAALRSFLRQDPDVIMVGEIRDQETAEIAVHASLTGHLVLSTLHTNDAPGAVTRLVEMGVERYNITTSVMAVLAQRLVRRLCPKCRVPYKPTTDHFLELGLEMDHLDETLADLRKAAASTVIGKDSAGVAKTSLEGDLVFYQPAPQGCESCSHKGYRGRIGIYELMLLDEDVRKVILDPAADSKAIQRAARRNGMRVLREDGARQVIAGITSIEEVLAATQAGEM
jgi:general secretion pathway protein E